MSINFQASRANSSEHQAVQASRFQSLYWLLILLLPSLAFAVVKANNKPVYNVHSAHWSNDYDRYFRKYAKRYFGPGFNWHWFKAQGIAESGLKPRAKSSVGAQGIMQIMAPTFAEIKKRNPVFASINQPRWNIAAAIYYDHQLYKNWVKRVESTDDRLAFTFASYNSGLGNALKAWKRGGKTAHPGHQWNKSARFAPAETRGYVARIQQLMAK